MSNFLKKGKRQQVKKDKKEIKSRMKHVYKILAELEDVAQAIINNEKETITDKNIEEIASKYTDLKITGYEKLILLSKLDNAGKINKEDILKDEINKDI